MYHFQQSDWINLLQYLSQTQLDVNSPWKYGDIHWLSSTGYMSTQKFSPVSDLKFSFGIGQTGSQSIEIQIKLPPNVNDGLSFHLHGTCSFQTAP
jgi:hypothetical protein